MCYSSDTSQLKALEKENIAVSDLLSTFIKVARSDEHFYADILHGQAFGVVVVLSLKHKFIYKIDTAIIPTPLNRLVRPDKTRRGRNGTDTSDPFAGIS